MIAVIFESGRRGHRRISQFAAWLRDDLARIDGFLSVERFQSLADRPAMSLSFWRTSRQSWRADAGVSSRSQVRGRAGIYDYAYGCLGARDYG